MRKPLDELQLADLKVQFRRMYTDLGFNESLVVLYEILATAAVLTEVIKEAKENESNL